MASKYLMNNILRSTSLMQLINSLMAPDHDEDQEPPSNLGPDVLFGITITDSRLDDELSVATIEFSDIPKWLQRLNKDSCGFPKKTPLGTIWKGMADMNARDEYGQTEFIRAVLEGTLNLHYAEMLAEFTDTDVNIQDAQGRTALHWACVGEFSEMVMLCLSVPECEIGLRDQDGITAFDISVRSASGNEVIPGLFYRSMFEMEDSHPQTALLRVLTVTSEPAEGKAVFPGIAIFEPVHSSNRALVKALVDRGIELTARNEDGDTALHVAAMIGVVDIANILIEAGSDVNAKGNAGATPLHYAAHTADQNMIQTLLGWDANPDARDDRGKTPLDPVAESQAEDIEELPHKKDSMTDMEEVEVEEESVVMKQDYMHPTLMGDQESGGQMPPGPELESPEEDPVVLLNSHAEVGGEVVEELAEKKQEDMKKPVLDLEADLVIQVKGAATMDGEVVGEVFKVEKLEDIVPVSMGDLESRDEEGLTALLRAVLQNDLVNVQRLLELGSDKEARDKSQQTALHLAARDGHNAILKMLVMAGSAIEALSVGGTALHLASKMGSKENVNTLLASGASIEAANNDKDRALHLAVHYGQTDTVKILLARRADIEATGDVEQRAIHVAALRGHTEIVKTLLAQGAQANARDKNKETALHLAVSKGHLEVVTILLDGKSKFYLGRKNMSRALHSAAISGHTEIVKVLLASGAPIEAGNENQWRALHLAAINGNTQTVETLLSAGAKINAKCGDGRRAIELAAGNGDTQTVTALLAGGAQRHMDNMEDLSSLHIAAMGGHKDTVQLLLGDGRGIDYWCSRGGTALQLAVVNRRTETVEVLVAGGAELGAVWLDEDGLIPNTPALYLAVKTGNREIVEIVLAGGARIEAVWEGHRALHTATSWGHKEIVQTLLSAGAEIEAVGPKSQRALHLAASDGHAEIVKLLLESGAQIEAGSHKNQRALHLAAGRGHTEIVKLLLASGAQIEAGSHKNQRALHLAAGRGHTEIVKILLAGGAQVDPSSGVGTALQLASKNGYAETVKALVAAGAQGPLKLDLLDRLRLKLQQG